MIDVSPIGIMDSGVGGLSVWQAINRLLPNEQTIYIADSLNTPYGDRSDTEIFFLASRLITFLLKEDVKLIVIACNTITVSCIDRLRQTFPRVEIVGTVPAIKTAVTLTKNKRIGILSTKRTAKSDYQHQLLDEFASNFTVVTVGTNKLVPLIEVGDREGVRVMLPQILGPFQKAGCDVVVLGCTHYPLIKDAIQEELGEKTLLIDSGEAIAKRVKDLLTQKNMLARDKMEENRFFTTGSSDNATNVLQQILKS